MSDNMAVVPGTLLADGTLQLDGKVSLPAGRVKVTIQSEVDLSKDPFWQTMEKIWADQRARGFVPRTQEEVEAEREAFRDEWEEKSLELQQIQEECRIARERTSAAENRE